MKKTALLFTMIALISFACSSGNALRPKHAQSYILEMSSVQLSGNDFRVDSDSWFGRDHIKLEFYENGTLLHTSKVDAVSGLRTLDPPLKWLIDFNPANSYYMVLTQDRGLAQGTRFQIPNAPRPGYWPFAENNGKINVGHASHLQFRETVVKK